MKLTDYEKMFLREAQCDYVLGYWWARSNGLSRHRARRTAVGQEADVSLPPHTPLSLLKNLSLSQGGLVPP